MVRNPEIRQMSEKTAKGDLDNCICGASHRFLLLFGRILFESRAWPIPNFIPFIWDAFFLLPFYEALLWLLFFYRAMGIRINICTHMHAHLCYCYAHTDFSSLWFIYLLFFILSILSKVMHKYYYYFLSFCARSVSRMAFAGLCIAFAPLLYEIVYTFIYLPKRISYLFNNKTWKRHFRGSLLIVHRCALGIASMLWVLCCFVLWPANVHTHSGHTGTGPISTVGRPNNDRSQNETE